MDKLLQAEVSQKYNTQRTKVNLTILRRSSEEYRESWVNMIEAIEGCGMLIRYFTTTL